MVQVFPVHKCRQYISECCNLVNSEWPKSKESRLQSLFMSSDRFPAHLVLILNNQLVVGHVRLTEINYGGDDIMVESVVIHKEHRNKGWGKILMEGAEEFVRRRGKKMLYLSTRGQEGFYEKLGYETCKPVYYLGFAFSVSPKNGTANAVKKSIAVDCLNAPPPPPLPVNGNETKPKTIFRDIKSSKTYMCKSIS